MRGAGDWRGAEIRASDQMAAGVAATWAGCHRAGGLNDDTGLGRGRCVGARAEAAARSQDEEDAVAQRSSPEPRLHPAQSPSDDSRDIGPAGPCSGAPEANQQIL